MFDSLEHKFDTLEHKFDTLEQGKRIKLFTF
jgi:hypothetical protein